MPVGRAQPYNPHKMTATSPRQPRVAFVHDWLTGMRGGEKVLRHLCGLIPDADIFTLIHKAGSCQEITAGRAVHTSILNSLPGVTRYYRHLLPVMPLIADLTDLSDYDIVIASSHCVAKGFGGNRPGQLKICYCHTPMRYAWDVGDDYRRRMGLAGAALHAIRPFLRAWDMRTAAPVDLFLANSACVADRIHRAYGRSSVVLHPPIDVDFFTPPDKPREDFYLMVSAMAPYKRVHHAIEAFSRLKLKRPLKIIGSGQELARLRRTAPANVELLGWQDDRTVRDHYRRCRAVVFPTFEDFGMVPLEAMACGTPVIAFAGGGAMETVRNAADPAVTAPTGLLYEPHTPDALAGAITEFEQTADRFNVTDLREWAEKFSSRNFVDGFKRAVSPMLNRFNFAEPWV